MKTVEVRMTDALYHGLRLASRRDGNDIGNGHGISALIRKCIKHQLTRLNQTATALEMDDQEFAESLARQARGADM